jgi:hypothetical protein
VEDAATPVAQACTDEQRAAAGEAFRKRVAEVDPCFSGSIGVMEATPEVREAYAQLTSGSSATGGAYRYGADGMLYSYELRVDRLVASSEFELCRGLAAVRVVEERVAEALAGESFACAAPYGIGVQGGAQQDLERLVTKAGRCVGAPFGSSGRDFRIVLDGTGAVADVRSESREEGAAEVRRCVRAALHGLVFPCLAKFEVCPEFVIIE